MVEVSEAAKETSKLSSCEMREILDVVLVCKDVESSILLLLLLLLHPDASGELVIL